MNARTKTFFHFTGLKNGFNTLQQILNDLAFWPKYGEEDVAWLGDPNFSKVFLPRVCFCDIPLLRTREHRSRYGDYGIGLCKEKAAMVVALNPVLYVQPDSILQQSLKEIISLLRQNEDNHVRTNGMILLAHCKPLEFYPECEWRFIPWVDGASGKNKYGFFLSEKRFAEVKNEANEERRGQMPEFLPDDVRYLVVKTRKDVSTLVSFIDSNSTLAHHDKTVRDMLKTRIVVLDEILGDL
jgi:Putative abortive phage resistance protein AbiGi, antitoxin